MKQIIFDSNRNNTYQNWRIVNDGVMGGLSQANFTIDQQGIGVFEGQVSLENNGGFSSVRCVFEPINVEKRNLIGIKIKGNKEPYQLRVKSDITKKPAYIYKFKTLGDWQIIEIPLKGLYPVYRGRPLELPNFNNNTIEQIAFLIANRKAQAFKLLIDSIWLQ